MSTVNTPQVAVEWASWDAHWTSGVVGSPASSSEVFGTMRDVGGPDYLGVSTTVMDDHDMFSRLSITCLTNLS
jgi:hypothetical protein